MARHGELTALTQCSRTLEFMLDENYFPVVARVGEQVDVSAASMLGEMGGLKLAAEGGVELLLVAAILDRDGVALFTLSYGGGHAG